MASLGIYRKLPIGFANVYRVITSASIGDEIFFDLRDAGDQDTALLWYSMEPPTRTHRGELITEGDDVIDSHNYYSWHVPDVTSAFFKTSAGTFNSLSGTMYFSTEIGSEFLDTVEFTVSTPYYSPKMSTVSVVRCKSDGTESEVHSENTYFKVALGGVDVCMCGVQHGGDYDGHPNNSYNIVVEVTPQGGTMTEYRKNIVGTSSGTFNASEEYLFYAGVDNKTTYSVSVYIEDFVGNTSSSISTKSAGDTVLINAADGGQSLAIGKFDISGNTEYLDIAWDTNIDGDVTIGGGLNFTDTDAFNTFKQAVNIADDYVVAQGGVLYSDDEYNADDCHYWTYYRKWNSGVLENWYWFNVLDISVSTAMGALYRSSTIGSGYEWEEPFASVVYPAVDITFNTTNGTPAWTWINYGTGAGVLERLTTTPGLYLVRHNDTGVASGVVSVHAVGRWK